MSTIAAATTARKRVDTLIIDTGPILSAAAAASYYLTSAERILTTPAVLAEIRDASARARFDTLWRPFIAVRSPRAESVRFVVDFAKKTGDFATLSATDLGLIALAHEAELEVAGGDWRLRSAPGKELNGPLPEGWGWDGRKVVTQAEEAKEEVKGVETELEELELGDAAGPQHRQLENMQEVEASDDSDDSDDSDGWITPANLHRHVHPNPAVAESAGAEKLTVALATTDFAMQNVLLQMNLHLLSPTSLMRIKSVRSTVLRCHGCFFVIRHPASVVHFCPRCGAGDTLRRVGCSTDADGVFRLHLKRNFQHNVRGNVFSLPKPVAGTASMKGVPDAPVLREDQKEYQRAVKWEGYRKEKDLLDPDHLPDILTGNRRRGSAIRVGAGRGKNPNEVRRTRKK